MSFYGIFIGACSFLIIGLLHPVIIIAEYHIGKRIWPLFLVLGAVCIGASMLAGSTITGSILGIFGFSLLWCIRELFEQEERVEKGWFPENPLRKPQKEKKSA